MIAPVERCDCETRSRLVTLPCIDSGAEWSFFEVASYDPAIQWTAMVGGVAHDLVPMPYYSTPEQAMDAGVGLVVPIDGVVYRLVPRFPQPLPREGEGC